MSARDDYPAIAAKVALHGDADSTLAEAIRALDEIDRLRRFVCSTCGGRQVVFDPKYVAS